MLDSVQPVYNKLKGTFQLNKLEEFKAKFKTLYSNMPVLGGLLDKMLEIHEEKRPDFVQLKKMLPRWEEIVNLVKQNPSVLHPEGELSRINKTLDELQDLSSFVGSQQHEVAAGNFSSDQHIVDPSGSRANAALLKALNIKDPALIQATMGLSAKSAQPKNEPGFSNRTVPQAQFDSLADFTSSATPFYAPPLEQPKSAQMLQMQFPQGQVLQNQFPLGQIPQNQFVLTQIPQGQIPQGQIPQGQIPQGQIPQGQIPQGQIPQGQIPQGQIPQGQIPQGQIPQGQILQGQIPQSQARQSSKLNIAGPILQEDVFQPNLQIAEQGSLQSIPQLGSQGNVQMNLQGSFRSSPQTNLHQQAPNSSEKFFNHIQQANSIVPPKPGTIEPFGNQFQDSARQIQGGTAVASGFADNPFYQSSSMQGNDFNLMDLPDFKASTNVGASQADPRFAAAEPPAAAPKFPPHDPQSPAQDDNEVYGDNGQPKEYRNVGGIIFKSVTEERFETNERGEKVKRIYVKYERVDDAPPVQPPNRSKTPPPQPKPQTFEAQIPQARPTMDPYLASQPLTYSTVEEVQHLKNPVQNLPQINLEQFYSAERGTHFEHLMSSPFVDQANPDPPEQEQTKGFELGGKQTLSQFMSNFKDAGRRREIEESLAEMR